MKRLLLEIIVLAIVVAGAAAAIFSRERENERAREAGRAAEEQLAREHNLVVAARQDREKMANDLASAEQTNEALRAEVERVTKLLPSAKPVVVGHFTSGPVAVAPAAPVSGGAVPSPTAPPLLLPTDRLRLDFDIVEAKTDLGSLVWSATGMATRERQGEPPVALVGPVPLSGRVAVLAEPPPRCTGPGWLGVGLAGLGGVALGMSVGRLVP